MTRILVIDDLRVFPFRPTYARTSAEGLAALDGTPWDQVWLDHDLGGADTIMPVVDWLCEQAHDGRPYPVGELFVHTSNAPAKRTMMLVLTRYGYQPVAVYADAHGGKVPSEFARRRGLA